MISIKHIENVNIKNDRQLLIFSKEQAESAWKCLQQQYKPVGTEPWKLQDIQQGIATLQLETSALFVPQMFNLQAIEGISFKKGCYTGQEVVARMKYLGKLKRRMYRLSLPIQASPKQKLPTPGSNCQLPEQEQSIGNVVTAAHVDESTLEILAVLTEEAAQSTTLIIDGNQCINIRYLQLPYEL
jgi:folate-binding protein YgfZ